ncbi:extracellular membrane protein, CFEM domain-containing protein [Pochonia chlamydosporia 170]|uniref:Extracellular membrane protein, CFEM domain-containing protein n=1 Tax=Pochonia chlamydosporia 170 TaxID=1380566 RepID=A0A179G485_METCM|nr:extracellular membrane protein, CFEM domain-containing protein [Pochonia chlamydosporia 170]OAQ72662.1 extracellular membrane protein, CFEM domain-containing protein [Pochonia chlamydosporia 170]
MKTAFVAAAGLLATASAQSLCAVNCFQTVVTEHPPLSCKEANMYLCFCKGKDLQNYFAQCAAAKCGSNYDETINFGVGLCKDLGVPIDPPARPATSTSSQAPIVTTPSTTSKAPVDTSVQSSTENGVKTSSTAAPPAQSTTSKGASTIATITQQPSHATNQTGTQPTSSGVVTAAAMNLQLAPAMLAAVGVGAMAVQLL